jgi:GntR family transcriptional regulator, transcriptional repressor for pyruvate dehydrogenase complex
MVKPSEAMLIRGAVVAQVWRLIREEGFRPGDRLPPERELAQRLHTSRSNLRAAIQSLSALGALESRRRSGTYIAEHPPSLESEPLSLVAALHGFTAAEIFLARRLLEVGLAGLAAENATADDLAAIAEEVTEMYSSLDKPQEYLVHDIRFHRAVAAASGNSVLATLMDMVSAALHEALQLTVDRTGNLKEAVEMHRKIYCAVRDHDVAEARAVMAEHLSLAERAFLSQDIGNLCYLENGDSHA